MNDWVPNPWTGNEESSSKLECDFLRHCIENNDPITLDHKIRIPWEDATGKLCFYTPNARHLKKKIIYDLSCLFIGADGILRLAGIKEWCNQNKFIMLTVTKTNNSEWVVIDWYKPKDLAIE